MKNTHEDRYENKLRRFMKELDNIDYRLNYEKWKEKEAEIYKKYGFTDQDWHRAIRLTQSRNQEDCYGVEHGKRYGYYRAIQRDKEKAFKKERGRYYINKQEQLDVEGEKAIAFEDRWLGDITDGFNYDDYLEYKEKNINEL